MKTWTNPEIEELEVKETAGGFWPYRYETCLTHGVGCGCPDNDNDNNNGDGDETDGDQEIPEDETPDGMDS